MPVYHALIEHGDFEKVLVCNAGHVKNVPGRKTDFADAEWLVHLLECGLLAGSFIPPADIKAARDVLRYRTKVAQQRVSEIARLGNVLQDAGHQDRLGGLLDRHQVRPGDDRGADRRGTPRPGAGRSGQGQDAGQDPGPGDGAGGPVRGPPRADVPPAPGPHRPPGGDDRQAGRADRGDDDALSAPAGPADHRPRASARWPPPRSSPRSAPTSASTSPTPRTWPPGPGCAPATTNQPANAAPASAATATRTCSPSWSSAPGRRSATRATSNPSTTGT